MKTLSKHEWIAVVISLVVVLVFFLSGSLMGTEAPQGQMEMTATSTVE